jgi:hypothetical protein
MDENYLLPDGFVAFEPDPDAKPITVEGNENGPPLDGFVPLKLVPSNPVRSGEPEVVEIKSEDVSELKSEDAPRRRRKRTEEVVPEGSPEGNVTNE